MSKFELKLPKMGESVAEATITSWLKEVGDFIELDDSIVEIATDKVDSDVPCDVSGVLIEKKFEVGDVVQIGQVLAVIETNADAADVSLSTNNTTSKEEVNLDEAVAAVEAEVNDVITQVSTTTKTSIANTEGNFYSPLVKKIASTEGISQAELDALKGTGLDGRVTKDDILAYVDKRTKTGNIVVSSPKSSNVKENKVTTEKVENTPVSLEVNSGDELITLSRMGKMISDHMVHSKRKASHVQSFIEVDVTNIVKWRDKVKDVFFKREGEKLTYTPIFMMAVAQAIKKYPLVNITFDGVDKVVVKKAINLGMASALPDGNLIVPVIKNAQNLNLVGMTKAVNDLATRSKNNALKPEDVKGGTYTVTNIGGFGSIFGTPIINQPESAILALGAIRKVPAVIETLEGDYIGIRQKMYISHSYDHRVINGALGGMFIKEIKDILEAWNVNQEL
ncbi:dihydrolipoamide acetyltransferase family protein [Wenyingzhuangia marina]|uniref:Dihydrolipoamide acetyltransferase component of pyruvate dehydrogenase complex n=1 Tax=Wenyingzhuangia marina TaxID=1195760 RepID=A0A1M5W438_9FLAO|nr:dihydrolipoamide acetyltransferase family protein [Wenyingzhuangia marina]GGF75982.1 dihydrolipoamide acetyltransferase component of pyruvate dehydrogenase complex [Wenyingzhuangia marina]SHH82282.1 2-oxoglutarate dehydrogenase E2 component (dihydrolipoamide succinyltransferase) [Wenyingzhuangia marina]